MGPAMENLPSILNVMPELISLGTTEFATGVFLVNFGGDTKYPYGTARDVQQKLSP